MFCFVKVDFSHIFTYSKLLNFNFNVNYQFKGELTKYYFMKIVDLDIFENQNPNYELHAESLKTFVRNGRPPSVLGTRL